MTTPTYSNELSGLDCSDLTYEQVQRILKWHKTVLNQATKAAEVRTSYQQTKRIGNLIKQQEERMLKVAGVEKFPKDVYAYSDLVDNELAIWEAQLTEQEKEK
jgi:hypothetical protein